MNAHARVSDQWTCEYEFEEIEIEEDGLFIGSFWGVAELAVNDPGHGDYYVKHIVLKGERRQSFGRGRVESKMQLWRPAQDARTFTAHLFRKIEESLYRDDRVGEFFWSEMEAD